MIARPSGTTSSREPWFIPNHYRANDPRGRAILKPADYEEPHEVPDDDYPFWLTTGRVVYQFHTRTKTARSKDLNSCRAGCLHSDGCRGCRPGWESTTGEMVEVASRRGRIQRRGSHRRYHPGARFHPVPLWRLGRPRAPPRGKRTDDHRMGCREQAAAFQVRRRERGESFLSPPGPATWPAPSTHGIGSAVTAAHDAITSETAAASGKMHVANYLGLARRSEGHLAESLRSVAKHHGHEPDVLQTTRLMALWSEENASELEPLVARYEESREQEPDALHRALFHGPRSGGLGLVRDLHDLWLLTQEVELAYELLTQAALALRDKEMESILECVSSRTRRQADWLRTRVDQAAPQALTVPS